MRMRTSRRKKHQGSVIEISVSHPGSGKAIAFYVFPSYEFAECAFDELRDRAQIFDLLARGGHHACALRRKRRMRYERHK